MLILLLHVNKQRKEMSEEEWRQRKLDKLLEGLKTDPNLASCRSIKRSEPMDGWTPMHAAAFKVYTCIMICSTAVVLVIVVNFRMHTLWQ
jgi:hypothetical protein